MNIGPRKRERVGRAVAGKAVDETQLEPSERGHDLTVVFAEAPDDKHTRKAQVKKLHLPATGSAKRPCEFEVHPRKGARGFEGRITVLYKGRVLQTARILGRVGSGPRRGPLDLQLAVIEVESAARAEASESIDAAIVLNDTAAGPTVTSIGGDEAIVTQIAEVKSLAETMSAAIALFTEQDRGEGALPAANMMELYRAVALPGSQVWKYLVKRFPPRVRTAKRLQVVEAAIGATLPVELFYRQPAPLANAKPCPGGPADGERACSACPDEMGAPKVVCLNQFWGFRTVVERRGLTEDVPAGAVAKLAAARDGDKPPPLKIEAAVYGTSDIVDSAMPPGTPSDLLPTKRAQKALESLVGTANVKLVTGLDEWEMATQALSPGIIVLLVHKAKVYGGDALQIGPGNPIPQGNILARHLVGPAGIHPIVVLMGCKTGLSKADVLGFVPWLTECGASAVISTLSPVLGRYAGPALATIIGVLGEKRGKGTFGVAVLEAKRRLLESGEPIGMCLVTFGDADLKL